MAAADSAAVRTVHQKRLAAAGLEFQASAEKSGTVAREAGSVMKRVGTELCSAAKPELRTSLAVDLLEAEEAAMEEEIDLKEAAGSDVVEEEA